MKRLFTFTAVVIFLLSFQSILLGKSRFEEKRVVLDSGGWKLVGDLLVPKSKKTVPAVIMLNKANGDRKVYERLAKQLAENGIASLRVDLRAHGESINKGKFGPPFDEKMRSLLDATHTDITAAMNYLKNNRKIDPTKIGVVGASYSGEEMAVAARKNGYAKAYVALSPGSFSEESLSAVDASGASWLFIKSAEERAASLKDFLTLVRQKSKTAQTMEVAGNRHATDIFESTPELTEILAVWFRHKL